MPGKPYEVSSGFGKSGHPVATTVASASQGKISGIRLANAKEGTLSSGSLRLTLRSKTWSASRLNSRVTWKLKESSFVLSSSFEDLVEGERFDGSAEVLCSNLADEGKE